MKRVVVLIHKKREKLYFRMILHQFPVLNR